MLYFLWGPCNFIFHDKCAYDKQKFGVRVYSKDYDLLSNVLRVTQVSTTHGCMTIMVSGEMEYLVGAYAI